MKFLIDENVAVQIATRLQASGHDVTSVQTDSPTLQDQWVLAAAASGERILLTDDKDFGELVFRLGQASGGVMLIRLAGLSNDLKSGIVAEVVRDHGDELVGAFTVVEPGRVRIRRSGAG